VFNFEIAKFVEGIIVFVIGDAGLIEHVVLVVPPLDRLAELVNAMPDNVVCHTACPVNVYTREKNICATIDGQILPWPVFAPAQARP
jgi:hypothetical protein